MTLIAVVDDDESVRESLQELLSSMGYGVEAFASGEELLAPTALPEPTAWYSTSTCPA